ncbi:hypothetical protein [Sphingobacterium bambusae]|uniref:Uncharacterized protein n=2 Tax=Sphingobacterium bambusae TaxID=662858 RepID=A0ABW6BG70_9SPHI|nr:hypothetical protein [Sphingobacterium bambusae]WPL49586.1 hypothetical protein SCB77_03860 [Sphingobacterium bambusae]
MQYAVVFPRSARVYPLRLADEQQQMRACTAAFKVWYLVLIVTEQWIVEQHPQLIADELCYK